MLSGGRVPPTHTASLRLIAGTKGKLNFLRLGGMYRYYRGRDSRDAPSVLPTFRRAGVTVHTSVRCVRCGDALQLVVWRVQRRRRLSRSCCGTAVRRCQLVLLHGGRECAEEVQGRLSRSKATVGSFASPVDLTSTRASRIVTLP